jgi:hypothetical protein
VGTGKALVQNSFVAQAIIIETFGKKGMIETGSCQQTPFFDFSEMLFLHMGAERS